MSKKLFVMSCAFLLTIILATSMITPFAIASVQANNTVDISKEYESGTVPVDEYIDLWYSWVNTNLSQFLYSALISEMLPPPFASLLVQHLMVSNQSDAFVGISLMLIEFYNDTNHNEIPDFDPATKTSEVKYIMVLNASEGATTYNISKNVINDTCFVFSWGLRYNKLQTVIANPDGTIIDFNGGILNALVDHFTLNFTLYIDLRNNRTILKQTFDIGNINLYAYMPPRKTAVFNASQFYSLSLSLLFGVVVKTVENATIISNNQSVNATNPDMPSTEITNSALIIGNRKVMEFDFDENYTIVDTNDTYHVKTVAYPKDAIPPWINSIDAQLNWMYSFIDDVLSQISVTGMNTTMKITQSSFVYRICYPYWNGSAIYHDPTITTFTVPQITQWQPGNENESNYVALLISPIIITTFIGILVTIFAVIRLIKIRKVK